MKYKIINSDSLFYMQNFMLDNSVDSVITDPPYGLNFMGKNWDKPDNIAFTEEFWKEVFRVLKPGGHVVSFGGSRTYHWLAIAIEKAGFEIRDSLMWIFGSGFPKSSNISLAVDKKLGLQGQRSSKKSNSFLSQNIDTSRKVETGDYSYFGEKGSYSNPKSIDSKKWEGWGTQLKPAFEPIVLARKPISEKTIVDNILKWGVGAINIDESRIPFLNGDQTSIAGKEHIRGKNQVTTLGQNQVASTQNDKGRWPANIILDNSEEVSTMLDTQSGISKSQGGRIGKKEQTGVGIQVVAGIYEKGNPGFNDIGGASRFFYKAKASTKDREEGCEELLEKLPASVTDFRPTILSNPENWNGGEKVDNPMLRTTSRKNNHPTVKPTDLMMYLIRLITPKGGVILDPFNGSGSTGKAAMKLNKEEGKDYTYIGIEMDENYCEISKKRIEFIGE